MEFNATFLVSIISFLVFTFIMNKIFYAPLTRVVEEREGIISKNYEDAETFDNDANTILKNRDERLSDVEKTARKMLSDKLDSSNLKSKNDTIAANQKSLEEISLRRETLAKEKDSAQNQLKGEVVGLAEKIASKVMGAEVKIEDVSQLDGIKL